MDNRNVMLRFASDTDFLVYDVVKYDDGLYCVECVDTENLSSEKLKKFTTMQMAVEYVYGKARDARKSSHTPLMAYIDGAQDAMNEFFDAIRDMCDDGE